MPQPDLSKRLEALDSCVVSDAMDSLGIHGGGVVFGITAVWDCGRIAGRAVTMRLRRLEPGETVVPGFHLGAGVIEASVPGDVIVVGHQGRTDSAGWGGLLSVAASTSGVRGVVVDGACRDVEEAEDVGLPLYARSVTPVSARGRTVEAEFGVPVDVDGVLIRPGDFVVLDRSGVVVIPGPSVVDVLVHAEQLHEREQVMRTILLEGAAVTEVMDQRYETMLERETPGSP